MPVIRRLVEDRERRITLVFSDAGYEFALPRGFRHRLVREGSRLDAEQVTAIVAEARAWRLERRARAAERRARRAAERPASGTISALEPNERRGVIYVALDGRFLVTLPASLADDERLRVGQVLDEAATARLVALGERAAVITHIDRLAQYRPRCRGELHDRLGRLGFAPEVIDAAADARLGQGVLDDDAYARWFLGARGVARGKGPGQLVHRLRALGIGDAAIREAVGRYDGEAAIEAAVPRAVAGLDLADVAGRRRAVERLLGRGFRHADVERALAPLVAAAEADRRSDEDADDPAPATARPAPARRNPVRSVPSRRQRDADELARTLPKVASDLDPSSPRDRHKLVQRLLGRGFAARDIEAALRRTGPGDEDDEAA